MAEVLKSTIAICYFTVDWQGMDTFFTLIRYHTRSSDHTSARAEIDMESRQSVKGVTSLVYTHEQPGYDAREGAALDVKVYSCNQAKWIVDVVWLNLVERSKFPQFSKPGEGDIDIS